MSRRPYDHAYSYLTHSRLLILYQIYKNRNYVEYFSDFESTVYTCLFEVLVCRDSFLHALVTRYANIPRYALKLTSTESQYILDDVDSDKLMIKIDHPMASLLKCEGRLFVCIGEVNDIMSNSKHVNQIHVDRLLEPTSFIGFQLLDLVPATINDDPSLKHDWKWSFQRGSSYRVPGQLVEPIDPGISLKELGKPFYLFESSTLRTIGAVLLERITRDDAPHVPVVQRSLRFPYCELNGSLIFISLILAIAILTDIG